MPRPIDTEMPPQPIPPTRFRVTLNCPTPVAHPELEVEADDESAAWREFCAANSISDSDHPRTIVLLVSRQ